ncbi:MAG: WD40 repeat domain-containing protein, partial [Acidimicrobiia bacterium]|nr:WD40 repeat domain-containing protein [Acidimicrobiia bacterium]
MALRPWGDPVLLFDPAVDRLIVDVGGGSSELIIYDPRTFEEVGRLDVIDAPNGATLSHDGTLLAVSSGDVLRCRTGVDVRIFELETGAVVDELEEDSCFAFPQFSPDDRYVTAVGERSVPVWDRTEPEGQPVLLQDATGFAGGPSAFGADGTTIIRANGDAVEPKSITTYKLATGHAIETRPLPVGAIRAVTSVPNTDKLLVATPTSGQFWAPGDVVAERKVPLTGLDHGTFSASGSLVALSGANSTVVVASADGATHLELRGHDGGVPSVSFSPDETMLAALVSSGEVVIWDLTPGGPPALANIETVGLDWLIPLMSSDGRYVATIERSGDTSVARRYATRTGALIAQSSPSSIEVAVSRSGEWAGGVDSDGVAWIERLGTNEVIFRRDCLAPAAINDEGTHAVFFSACGGKTTSLIDLRNGATISSWTRDGDPEFGPPGSPADGLFVDNNDSGPVFRSVSTGDIVAAPYIGKTWRPRFSADGRYLSLGSGYEGGYVLNVEAIVAGAPKDEVVVINPLVEGGPTRTAMASGSFGVTTHNEDSIRVWSLATEDQWMNIPTQATTFAFVAMSPDGTVLYYPDHDGVLVRALLDPEELAKLARARTTRDFTVEECQQFNIVDDCSIYEPEPARG